VKEKRGRKEPVRVAKSILLSFRVIIIVLIVGLKNNMPPFRPSKYLKCLVMEKHEGLKLLYETGVSYVCKCVDCKEIVHCKKIKL